MNEPNPAPAPNDPRQNPNAPVPNQGQAPNPNASVPNQAPSAGAPAQNPVPAPAPGASAAQASEPEPLRFGGITPKQYWRRNIICVLALLVVWFVVSYGCGILWADELDKQRTPGGGVKLGFWWAQQGSIYVFVLLIGIYVLFMNRLDAKYRGSKR